MVRATCPGAHAPRCRNAYPRDLPSAHASEPVCPAYFRAHTRSEAQYPSLHQNVGWGSNPGTTEMKPPGGLERPACARAFGSAVWRALQLSVPTHGPVSSVPNLPRADLCEFPPATGALPPAAVPGHHCSSPSFPGRPALSDRTAKPAEWRPGSPCVGNKETERLLGGGVTVGSVEPEHLRLQ